jgi:signal peptidase I
MSNSQSGIPRWRVFTRKLFCVAERLLAVVGLVTVVYFLFFEVSVIVSPSMAPTLKGTSVKDGDWVLTEKPTLWLREPRRWEVITFMREDHQRAMKRVVALPGEEIALPPKSPLLVDGQPVELPIPTEMNYLRYGNLAASKPVACGDGYYVLGDDVRDSDDSRFNGPVRRDQVIGRAWLIIWPLSRFGFVNP